MQTIGTPGAGSKENSIVIDDGHIISVQSSNLDCVTLGNVLSNSKTINLFMLHLGNEFSMECLLSLIEFCQFQNYVFLHIERNIKYLKITKETIDYLNSNDNYNSHAKNIEILQSDDLLLSFKLSPHIGGGQLSPRPLPLSYKNNQKPNLQIQMHSTTTSMSAYDEAHKHDVNINIINPVAMVSNSHDGLSPQFNTAPNSLANIDINDMSMHIIADSNSPHVNRNSPHNNTDNHNRSPRKSSNNNNHHMHHHSSPNVNVNMDMNIDKSNYLSSHETRMTNLDSNSSNDREITPAPPQLLEIETDTPIVSDNNIINNQLEIEDNDNDDDNDENDDNDGNNDNDDGEEVRDIVPEMDETCDTPIVPSLQTHAVVASTVVTTNAVYVDENKHSMNRTASSGSGSGTASTSGHMIGGNEHEHDHGHDADQTPQDHYELGSLPPHGLITIDSDNDNDDVRKSDNRESVNGSINGSNRMDRLSVAQNNNGISGGPSISRGSSLHSTGSAAEVRDAAMALAMSNENSTHLRNINLNNYNRITSNSPSPGVGNDNNNNNNNGNFDGNSTPVRQPSGKHVHQARTSKRIRHRLHIQTAGAGSPRTSGITPIATTMAAATASGGYGSAAQIGHAQMNSVYSVPSNSGASRASRTSHASHVTSQTSATLGTIGTVNTVNTINSNRTSATSGMLGVHRDVPMHTSVSVTATAITTDGADGADGADGDGMDTESRPGTHSLQNSGNQSTLNTMQISTPAMGASDIGINSVNSINSASINVNVRIPDINDPWNHKGTGSGNQSPENKVSTPETPMTITATTRHKVYDSGSHVFSNIYNNQNSGSATRTRVMLFEYFGNTSGNNNNNNNHNNTNNNDPNAVFANANSNKDENVNDNLNHNNSNKNNNNHNNNSVITDGNINNVSGDDANVKSDIHGTSVPSNPNSDTEFEASHVDLYGGSILTTTKSNDQLREKSLLSKSLQSKSLQSKSFQSKSKTFSKTKSKSKSKSKSDENSSSKNRLKISKIKTQTKAEILEKIQNIKINIDNIPIADDNFNKNTLSTNTTRGNRTNTGSNTQATLDTVTHRRSLTHTAGVNPHINYNHVHNHNHHNHNNNDKIGLNHLNGVSLKDQENEYDNIVAKFYEKMISTQYDISFPGESFPQSSIVFNDDASKFSIVYGTKQVGLTQLKKKCYLLYRKYIATDCKYEINIGSSHRKYYTSKLDNWNTFLQNNEMTEIELFDIFEPCMTAMIDLMKQSFARFKHNKAFQKYMKDTNYEMIKDVI